MVDGLDGGMVAGSPMEFSESSGKTSHIISHSCSIPTMSCSMLACKGEVVKVIEAFIDGRVGRSVGGSESRLEWSKEWHSSVGCQGVFSLQLR